MLAPTSVADTFATTVEAFNIAEQYQTPVILLSDGEIGQRKEIVDPIDTQPVRDRRTPAAVAARAGDIRALRADRVGHQPDQRSGHAAGGNYLAAGIEHNEHGAPTANGAMHAQMNEKRIRKLDPLMRWRGAVTIDGRP